MEWQNQLRDAFSEIARDIPDNVGVLFSGGLDSSFLAYIIKMKGKSVHLYSSGTEASHDKKWAREAADMLGLPISFLKRNDDDIMNAIIAMKQIDKTLSPLELLIELSSYFVIENSGDTVLISGQGADELFLGYKKYESKDTSPEDIEKVTEIIIPFERELSMRWGRRMVYPYLDDRIIKIAGEIPHDFKIRDGQRKYILRKIASDFGLNDSIAWKQKKASQYSSGYANAVRKIAARHNKSVHEFIEDL